MEVADLIKLNDAMLKKREDKLIQEVNRVYDEAIARATEKLKGLKPEELTRENVRKILEEVADSFNLEFEKLTGPFQEAIAKSYDEGLKETGLILNEIKGGK